MPTAPFNSPSKDIEQKTFSFKSTDCFCLIGFLRKHTYKYAIPSHQYHTIFTLHAIQNQLSCLSMGSTLNSFYCIIFTLIVKQ
ncbi:hypothetical protein DENIT_60553 [Pseudomonas veronii]|nr:hypothetical protein DENIT_60553 [Pseudomonas veronii]